VIIELIASIIGLIAFLIVPGLIWSYIFFPRINNDSSDATKDSIPLGLTVRLIVSICLSLALVSISIFYLDYLFSLHPSFFTTTVSVVGISLLGIIILYFSSPNFIKQCAIDAIENLKDYYLKIRSGFKGHQ